jgi:chromosome segregation ATPase
MKNFLVGLLISLSLCLCGLIWFQWVREAHSRQEVESLKNGISGKLVEVQSLQSGVRRAEEEIKRLDSLKNELTATGQSNRQEIARLTGDLQHANADVERQLKQISLFKEALDRANESIKKQNEDVKRQNEEMKKLAEERNEIVTKFNKTVAEFNDLAGKWNALQEQLASTNAPPANPPKPSK